MAESLLAALVRDSKTYGDPLAAEYASGNRSYLVTLTRPSAPSSFDRTSGQFLNVADQVLYIGPARVYGSSGASELEIGDERTPFTSTTISIDDYAGLGPEVDDVVQVMDTPQAQANNIALRFFEVTGVDVGGHFGIGWTLRVLGAGPSRHGGRQT